MTRPPRRPHGRLTRLAALICAVALAATACTGGTGGRGTTDASSAAAGITPTVALIPAAEGAELVARVYRKPGSGTAPLLVMPGSWGAGPAQYDTQARQLAAAGYVVVSYAQRGFGGSGGLVDLAGPATQQDVGTVVSWALHNTPADPSRIGAVGSSYGGIMSLLGAERDDRIKAVVAMSTWADLATALTPDGVLNAQGLDSLLRQGGATTSGNPDVRALQGALLQRDTAAAASYLRRISAERSPITGVDALNRNGTAVMIANAYQDSLFPPSSLIPFYERLTGPKRLQLETGDHAAPERIGLRVGRARVWDDAHAWLDHYLRGVDNGIDTDEPIQLKDGTTGAWRGYPDVASLGSARSLALRAPGGAQSAVPGAGSAWTVTLTGATVTPADSGPTQVDVAKPFAVPSIAIATVTGPGGARWTTDATTSGITISGQARAHLTVADSAARGALFAYLYDVDAQGTARLIELQPHLLTGRAGTARDVDLIFPPIAWTLAAGHQLALVVDTVDARYDAATAPGTKIRLSSTATDSATLTVPITR